MSIDPELLMAIKSGYEAIVVSYIKDHNKDGYCVRANGYIYDCVNVNSRNDQNGWTLLHHAIFFDQPKIVSLLLDLGADLEAKTKRGMTPLHLAAYHNKIEATRILLNVGANINTTGNRGNTPLQTAYYKNNTEIIELLEKAHNKTITTPTIESAIKSITDFNISGGIIDMRNSTLPIIITPTMSLNSSQNAKIGSTFPLKTTPGFDSSTTIANSAAQSTLSTDTNVLFAQGDGSMSTELIVAIGVFVVGVVIAIACLGKKLYSSRTNAGVSSRLSKLNINNSTVRQCTTTV